MKKLNAVLLCFIMLVSASCIGLNQSPLVNYQPSSAVISGNNYKVIRSVSGECSQLYICGFGGMSYKSKQSNAIQEMYNNAQLKEGQAIININVTYTKSIYVLGIVVKVNAIATGTMIEFTDSAASPIVGDTHLVPLESSTPTEEPIVESIKSERIDIQDLQRINDAPHQCIGEPAKLSEYKEACFTVYNIVNTLDSDDIEKVQQQFKKYFHKSMSANGKIFSLKKTQQAGKLTLVITNYEAENYTAYALFFDRNNNNFVSYYLGNDHLPILAQHLADKIRPFLR